SLAACQQRQSANARGQGFGHKQVGVQVWIEVRQVQDVAELVQHHGQQVHAAESLAAGRGLELARSKQAAVGGIIPRVRADIPAVTVNRIVDLNAQRARQPEVTAVAQVHDLQR